MIYKDKVTNERVEIMSETPNAYFILVGRYKKPMFISKLLFMEYYKEAEENEMSDLSDSL